MHWVASYSSALLMELSADSGWEVAGRTPAEGEETGLSTYPSGSSAGSRQQRTDLIVTPGSEERTLQIRVGCAFDESASTEPLEGLLLQKPAAFDQPSG